MYCNDATARVAHGAQHVSVHVQLGSKGEILNDHLFRANSSADYIARASKVITMVDLAGHERYFKTTAYGLTGHLPDYACLIIGANAGPDPLLTITCLAPAIDAYHAAIDAHHH